jgi:hypothetical protein
VWGRVVDGLALTFHLAGINNQNFLMKDEETGTYWQQISGRAISGPLAGQSLRLIPSDELTFALWKSEQPDGEVLKGVPADALSYAPKDWEGAIRKAYPTVLNYAEPGLANRDVMLGVEAFGEARAFPYEQIIREKLITDHVGTERLILLVGPDERSVRAFREKLPTGPAVEDTVPEFFRNADGLMMDSATGSRWNFQGCAVEGRMKGLCLERIEVIKDFWFDWRNYHPATSVYSGRGKSIGRPKG